MRIVYALCSPHPESKTQSLDSPNRSCDLADFDCGALLAVSQITKAV